MFDRYGIILIDGNEILIRIYEKDAKGIWKLLLYQHRDLATFSKSKPVEASEFIEVIAQTSLTQYAVHVMEWKICARNIDEELMQKIHLVTNIASENLGLH